MDWLRDEAPRNAHGGPAVRQQRCLVHLLHLVVAHTFGIGAEGTYKGLERYAKVRKDLMQLLAFLKNTPLMRRALHAVDIKHVPIPVPTRWGSLLDAAAWVLKHRSAVTQAFRGSEDKIPTSERGAACLKMILPYLEVGEYVGGMFLTNLERLTKPWTPVATCLKSMQATNLTCAKAVRL